VAAKKAVTIEKGDPEVNATGPSAPEPVSRREKAIVDRAEAAHHQAAAEDQIVGGELHPFRT
tara:strand:- start:1273 stop:1458 length:186 start_codon:yes stop_codon:yes gene_type:complete